MFTRFLTTAALIAVPGFALADSHAHGAAERIAAPEGASVYLIGLEDGATVSNPVTLRFGARGIGIAPAGVEWDNTGHHHLIINVDPADIDYSEGLPATDNIRHFGGGQTEVTLDLPTGTHTMWLLMGDWTHTPHEPPVMSEPISVTVQ